MKIYKFIIFLLMLNGIFFVIYGQSNKKGFRQGWKSLRTAAFLAGVLTGLIPIIPNSAEAHETYTPNNSSSISIERVVDSCRGGFRSDPCQEKEIIYRIKEDPGLVRAAEEACEDANVQKDVNHLQEELAKGNKKLGIGRKRICKGVLEHRGRNGGRLYTKEYDNKVEILAKSGKDKSNQQFVIKRLKETHK